jgi:hypothetical protein
MKYRRIPWTGHAERTDTERNAYTFLVGKFLGKRTFKDRRNWRIILRWIELVHYRIKCGIVELSSGFTITELGLTDIGTAIGLSMCGEANSGNRVTNQVRWHLPLPSASGVSLVY